jgi:hypothetical protein
MMPEADEVVLCCLPAAKSAGAETISAMAENIARRRLVFICGWQ